MNILAELNPPSSRFIYRTSISTDQVLSSAECFLSTYAAAAGEPAKYLSRLLHHAEAAASTPSARGRFPPLDVDMGDLQAFDPVLCSRLTQYPQEVIPIFDVVASNLLLKHVTRDGASQALPPPEDVVTRPYFLSPTTNLRDLGPRWIDQLVALTGFVTRVDPITPEIRSGHFQCAGCGSQQMVPVVTGRLMEPSCSACHKARMLLVHACSVYDDKQMIRLQELSSEIPDGSRPATMALVARAEWVDAIVAGETVCVTGIYRTVPAGRSGKVQQVFRPFVDVVYLVALKGGRDDDEPGCSPRAAVAAQDDDPDLPPILQAHFATSPRPRPADGLPALLLSSFAPSIFSMSDVKLGLLCQLFGGTPKPGIGARSEINVLLCGDPGTSKSQLLQFSHRVAPRGISTSGRGSSAVGLTASVSRDATTGEMVLESGALTLSDRGLCCIDEFDKISPRTRAVLHEAMEQQTVSVAKAGIIATLNARAAILACANCSGSRYDTTLTVVDNIQLSPTLMSRFDLIFLVLDRASPEHDVALAKHVLAGYVEGGGPDASSPAAAHPPFSIAQLSQIIQWARKHCHPKLSDEAADALVEAYLVMRRDGLTKHMISATARQLESLVRICEALAKMRLDQNVTAEDVREATRLMTVATCRAAVDPVTGRLDMNLLATGHSASHERRIQKVCADVMTLLHASRSQPERSLLRTLRQLDHDQVRPAELSEAIRQLEREGRVAVLANGVEQEGRIIELIGGGKRNK